MTSNPINLAVQGVGIRACFERVLEFICKKPIGGLRCNARRGAVFKTRERKTAKQITAYLMIIKHSHTHTHFFPAKCCTYQTLQQRDVNVDVPLSQRFRVSSGELYNILWKQKIYTYLLCVKVYVCKRVSHKYWLNAYKQIDGLERNRCFMPFPEVEYDFRIWRETALLITLV